MTTRPSRLGPLLRPQPPPHRHCLRGSWAAPPCSCCGSPGPGWPSTRVASSCFTAQQARPPSLAPSCCQELSPPTTSASSVRWTWPGAGGAGQGAAPGASRRFPEVFSSSPRGHRCLVGPGAVPQQPALPPRPHCSVRGEAARLQPAWGRQCYSPLHVSEGSR